MLATDLDGTFLAGTPERRHELYHLLSARTDLRLVYLTGRGLETVLPLLSDPSLPRPDYIVCDVGATIVDGRTLQPVQPLQDDIEARWPGERMVVEALGAWDGLERQDVPQDRRVSYYCAPETVTEALRATVEKLDLDLLYSAGRYLDVMPRGVSKGAALHSLVSHLELPDEAVVVAGDTLNDLSLYQYRYRGVCVGDSEPGLLEATRGLPHVHHAEEPGCGGILEALAHFGLYEPLTAGGDGPAMPSGDSELVIVYHRLPYEEYVVDDEVRRRNHASPNGIIPTLLSFFADGRKGAWVAWTQHAGGEGFDPDTEVEPERYPGLIASRVALTKDEVDIFYKRFSKEAFWPLLHTFWERATFREDHWLVYLRVNRAFAERTAAQAAIGATVWIHDYNLWMVPAYLRDMRPDLKIAFFHHTYFPSADVFNVVPWRREILGSLLQCDYIGFHIPRQVENFVDVVRGVQPVTVLEREPCAPRYLTYGVAVGIERMTTALRTHGRTVRLGAHPVGLDMNRVRSALRGDAMRKRRAELASNFSDRQLILSVERLDYTKGTLEKLQAFEQILAGDPELHGNVSLLCICVPAAREMTIYDELQDKIEQAVGRINGRFSRVGWVPVQFFFRAVPFDELVAYYAEADVMWITPLRDGLNLVCKEYVATQGLTRGDGVLVLSEFAGAAAELKGALLTNPHDIADLAAVCRQAIHMPRGERRHRIRGLVEIVRHHDIERWGNEFLAAVEACRPEDGGGASRTADAAPTTTVG